MTRRNFVDGMEITFGDLSKIPAGVERNLFDRILHEMLQQKNDAFFGDGFKVTRSSATQTAVATGHGFQLDATQVSPEPVKRFLRNTAIQTLNHDAPHATNNRIDIVCVASSRANTDSQTRKYKAPTTGTITNETLVVETDWSSTLLVVAGTPAGSPVAPSTPAGYLKLAEVVVTAVTGIAASGAITDSRTKLPVGGDVAYDTTGFNKITAGVATKMSTILAAIDTALTSGGGGGGGMQWQAVEGLGPLQSQENGLQVFQFEAGATQQLVAGVVVPSGYVAGSQIKMNVGQYSPSASGTQLLTATTYLIAKNSSAVSSTTNSRVSTNTALTNTVTDQYRQVLLDLTDSLGKVNGVSVAAGDILRVVLGRGTDTDTADVRFIPSVSEPKFA